MENMNDITMCLGKIGNFICPLRKKCYRFTTKRDEYYQSFFTETPYNKEKKECKYFWNNKNNKNNKKG